MRREIYVLLQACAVKFTEEFLGIPEEFLGIHGMGVRQRWEKVRQRWEEFLGILGTRIDEFLGIP